METFLNLLFYPLDILAHALIIWVVVGTIYNLYHYM